MTRHRLAVTGQSTQYFRVGSTGRTTWDFSRYQAAVAARNNAGDSRVHFVHTEGWLTAGADRVYGDDHPDDEGQAKIADRLAPIIASRI